MKIKQRIHRDQIAETGLFFGKDPRGCGPLIINTWSTIGPRAVRSTAYFFNARKRRWQREHYFFAMRGTLAVTDDVFPLGQMTLKRR